jgi:CRISPR-associated exonuclease Cas4
MPGNDEDFFFRSADKSVHWTFGDIISSTLDAAIVADRTEVADERERLLYVACTRALDLLVLPAPSWAPDGGWAKFFDLGQSVLAEIGYPAPQPPEPITPSASTGRFHSPISGA